MTGLGAPALDRRLRVWTGLLVGVSIAALLSAEERALLAAPVLASALVCLLRLVPRLRVPEPLWTAASVLALALFALELSGWSRRSSLLSATELLLYVLANKVHHLRTTRDLDQLLVVTFLLVLAVCVLAVELVVVAFFLVYLFVALRTMELLHAHREREGDALELVPHGAAGVDAAGAGSTRRALLAAAAVAAVATPLFFAFPRIGAGTFQSSLVRPQHVSGFSGEVDLDDLRAIMEDPTLVGRVKPEGPLGRNVTHLRAVGFRGFDGRRWMRDEDRSRPLQRQQGGTRYTVGAVEAPAPLEWFEVTSEVLSPPVLPVPSRPVYVEGQFMHLQSDKGGTLTFAPARSTSQRITYRVAADLVPPPDARLLEGTDPPDVQRGYLRLPRLSPRIAAFAAELAPSTASRLEVARAVERRLSRDYRYSLDVDPSPDALAHFLFERKAGHCELFASSMAVLLRSRGIPARLVNGFRLSEWSDLGEYFIVRQSDAHAWVEVYFPDGGWVKFDPTPPDPSRLPASRISRAFSHLADFAAYKWDRYVISWSLTDQRLALEAVRDRLKEAPAALAGSAGRLARAAALPAVVALLLGLVVVALLLAIRSRRWRGADREAVLLYEELRRELVRAGAVVGPSTGPGELLERFGSEPHTRRVLELYIEARFAGGAPDRRRLRSGRKDLRGVRRRILVAPEMTTERRPPVAAPPC